MQSSSSLFQTVFHISNYKSLIKYKVFMRKIFGSIYGYGIVRFNSVTFYMQCAGFKVQNQKYETKQTCAHSSIYLTFPIFTEPYLHIDFSKALK